MTIPEAAPLTIYVCGPMTGIKDFNYPAFNEAAAQLQAAGYKPLNPTCSMYRYDAPRPHIEEQGGDWPDYMRNALNQVIRADGIATLPGWTNSRGATLEVYIANQLGMVGLPLDAWLRNARRRAIL